VKHPLLDKASAHYDTRDKPTIYYIEEELTVNELIGACKFNIMKYIARDKGQNERDEEKARRYDAYLSMLMSVPIDRMTEKARAIIDERWPDLEYVA